MLTAIALGLAAVVALGLAARAFGPFAAVALTTLAAASATFLCNALAVGPPGAYMIALAAATGTALPGDGLGGIAAGLVVLAGGVVAIVMQMAGGLVSPRGPEQKLLKRADAAVSNFLEARGSPAEFKGRHAAAAALHDLWSALSVRQRPDAGLAELRAAALGLHLAFVGGYAPAPLRRESAAPAALAGPSHADLLAEAVSPWSPPLVSALRVGLATALAGLAGALLGIDRAYWAMASAVLVLHQGLGRRETSKRAFERVAGTFAGLVLAAACLRVGFAGYALALWLGLLQFLTELLVVERYVLAVMFITTISLTIATGGHAGDPLAGLLRDRALDTILGCGIGLAVFFLTRPRAIAARLRSEMAATLDEARAVVEGLAGPDVRNARRRLQRAAIRLLRAYESNLQVSDAIREQSERVWPAIALVEDVAYATLAAGWRAELSGATDRAAAAALAKRLAVLSAEAAKLEIDGAEAAFCAALEEAGAALGRI